MKPSKKLKLMALLSGNTLEWLEFTLFAYLAHIIAPHFFSEGSTLSAQLKSYMTFGSSYLARPFGALVFGYIGDRIGRVKVLQNSLIIMSLTTALIPLIPSHKEIGFLSPLFLLILRILQGFSVSGEFSSSQLVLVEELGKKKPFLFGALGPFSASLGMLLGSLLASLVYSGFLPENSWRIAFLGSSFLGFLGYFIRKNFNETEAFKKVCQSKSFERHPPLAALIKNPFSFFVCFLSAMFVSNFVYLGSFFFEKLALQEGLLPPFETHLTIIYGQALATLTMILVAPFIQKEKALYLCITSLGCAIVLSPLMIYCSVSGSFALLFLGQTLYGTINGTISSVLITFVSLQFPPQRRLSGWGLSWSLGAALFGGTSLTLGEVFRSNGYPLLIGFYISMSALFPFLLLVIKKRKLYGLKKLDQRNSELA